MKQFGFDPLRSYRDFGTKAKGMRIIYDKKEGIFFGWTIHLYINGSRPIHGYSRISLQEAMKHLRYQLECIGKIKGMVRSHGRQRKYGCGMRDFTSDFLSPGKGEKYWCRKDLLIDGLGFKYKIEFSYAWRDTSGKFQKVKPKMSFSIHGNNIKEIKATVNALLNYATGLTFIKTK